LEYRKPAPFVERFEDSPTLDSVASFPQPLSFAKTDHAKKQWFMEGDMLPFEMVGSGTDTSRNIGSLSG